MLLDDFMKKRRYRRCVYCPAKAGKGSGYFRKGKPVPMEKLMLQAEALPEIPVHIFISIFCVSHYRMADACQMGPDLMRPAGDKADQKKRFAAAAPQRSVIRFYGLAVLHLFFIYYYFITFCILM